LSLASEAERLAVGTGWLPVMLRTAVQEAPETLPDAETDESASE